MPPCSCAFLSIRRRTESHPCVPQKGRHNHEPVQIHLSAAARGQPVTSGLCSFIVAPTPKAGPHRQQVNFVNADGGKRKVPERFGFAQDVCGPFKTPSFSRHQKCPSPAPLSAFPAFAAQQPKKNTEHGPVIWQHSDSESCVLFRCACLQHHVSLLFFFIVQAFLLAAISRFIREAAHLHPLNASQQQGPFSTQGGLFPFPLQRQPSNHSGHHGNSPVTVAGAAGA